MLSANRFSFKLSTTSFVLVMIAAFGLHLRAQETQGPPKAAFVDDWTHHHLIFSNPGAREDAVRNKTLDKWQGVNDNPRYQMQQIKRNMGPRPVIADPDFAWRRGGDWDRDRDRRRGGNPPGAQGAGIKKDWDEVLGGGTSLIFTVAAPNATNITGGTSTLTIDGQTFTASAPSTASQTGAFTGNPTAGQTVTIMNGTNVLTLTAVSSGSNGCTSSTTGTFVLSGFFLFDNGDLATAINTCNSSYPAVGLNATNNFYDLTVTADAAGSAGNNIALGASLSNFGWFGTKLTGGSDGTTDANDFAYWSGSNYATAGQLASNIATAAGDNSTVSAVIGATADPSNGEITFTKLAGTGGPYSIAAASFPAFTPTTGTLSGSGVQAAVQPNVFPAKFGASLTAADCTHDFVVYPTGQAGSTTAATIIAYNNIYVGTGGCETSDPAVYWAYNTHTGYTVTTSPILSRDGTQVAFMESTASTAELVLVKWAGSTTNSFSSPAAPTLEASGAAYEACTGASTPCMYRIGFGNGNNDSLSSPFYDYANDVIYVGDDSGYLHRFTGVFLGAPAEVTTGGWPIQVGTAQLSSPVYDYTSGYVFVGNMTGTLYSVVGGAAASVHGSAAIGDAIADGPVVDSTEHVVYAFVTTGTVGEPGSNVIYQFSTAFTGYGTPGFVAIGTGGAGYYLYNGMFDNTYFQSANGTGNLWVVGNTGVTTGASLYRVGVSGGNLSGSSTAVVNNLTPNATGAYPWPSPLTEFYNAVAGIDYVFFSVNRGNKTGCTNTAGHGCIMSYNINNPASPTLAGAQDYTTPGGSGCWATGGIVIDNDANTTGASQIYFIGLDGTAAGGPKGATSSHCAASTGYTVDAIQAAQSAP
jgi:hypothetical protein